MARKRKAKKAKKTTNVAVTATPITKREHKSKGKTPPPVSEDLAAREEAFQQEQTFLPQKEDDSPDAATEEQYVPISVTKAEYDKIKKDLPKLELFHDCVKERLKTLVDPTERLPFVRLDAIAEEKINELREVEQLTRTDVEETPRIFDIGFKIKSSQMSFSHDYRIFEERVNNLFEWHSEEKNMYVAPYFAMVQSSGMGKTKLMYEFKQRQKQRKVFLILCVNPHVQSAKIVNGVYDFKLEVPAIGVSWCLGAERQRIRKVLDDLVKDLAPNSQVVFLFDEAQFLVSAYDAFAFRVIRYWLQWHTASVQAVGVYAGTDSKLMNLLNEDSPTSRFSGEPGRKYNTGEKLYDPFFQLCTIGVEKNRVYSYEAKPSSTDLDRAVKFGRPLFAHLAMENELDDKSLRDILARILLSENVGETLSAECCLSVLGTRVQMGQTSWRISSKLVSDGYACLTDCVTPSNIANICFFPDPVCAYLAMKMMATDDKDSFVYGKGRRPKFWSGKATEMFTTALCRPDQGDVGKVAAALYLLFCGDVLRSGKTFVVGLSGILQLAAEPNVSPPADYETNAKATVSFIQVCRNYLRHTVDELSWPTNRHLEEWFTAGCAFYAYPLCRAYDIIAPVRFDKGEDCFSYHPLLISVINRTTFTEGRCDAAIQQMREILLSTRSKTGVCVLLLIGLPSSPNSGESKASAIRGLVQNWDGESILSFVIKVPEGDCFGCWDMATQASIGGVEESEVFASHFTTFQTAKTDRTCL